MSRNTRIATILVLLAVVVIWWLARTPTTFEEPPEPFAAYPEVERDLPQILGDTLRVLVLSDPLCYEWRPRAESGMEFELLARFAREQGVPLAPVIVDHPDSMRWMLQQGHGDVMAASLARNGDMVPMVAMTAAYGIAVPLLATLRPGFALEEGHAPLALSGHWSPFAHADYRFADARLSGKQLERDTIHLPEDLLAEVVLGRLAGLVVPDLLADREAERFPLLQFEGPVGPPVELAFAVRTNAPLLLRAMDAWMVRADEVEARKLLLRAGRRAPAAPGPLRPRVGQPLAGAEVSEYDEVFRRHAGPCGLPWELLAAMAWKESRFNPEARSSKGAFGIMQMMPRTATRMGLDSAGTVDDQVAAAARYLCYLDTFWMRAIPQRAERLHFVLASYNSGPGHVVDAQRLAEQLGADPDRWEGHVERTILLKAKPRYHLREGMRNGYVNGAQTFLFVRGVMAQYARFQRHALQAGKSLSSSSEASSGGP